MRCGCGGWDDGGGGDGERGARRRGLEEDEGMVCVVWGVDVVGGVCDCVGVFCVGCDWVVVVGEGFLF